MSAVAEVGSNSGNVSLTILTHQISSKPDVFLKTITSERTSTLSGVHGSCDLHLGALVWSVLLLNHPTDTFPLTASAHHHFRANIQTWRLMLPQLSQLVGKYGTSCQHLVYFNGGRVHFSVRGWWLTPVWLSYNYSSSSHPTPTTFHVHLATWPWGHGKQNQGLVS